MRTTLVPCGYCRRSRRGVCKRCAPYQIEVRQTGPDAFEVRQGGDAPTALTYQTICVSTYPEQLALLDALVDDLRRIGVMRANRSSVIRALVRAQPRDEQSLRALGAQIKGEQR